MSLNSQWLINLLWKPTVIIPAVCVVAAAAGAMSLGAISFGRVKFSFPSCLMGSPNASFNHPQNLAQLFPQGPAALSLSEKMLVFRAEINKSVPYTDENSILAELRERHGLAGGIYVGNCVDHTRAAVELAQRLNAAHLILQGEIYDLDGNVKPTYALIANREVFWKASPPTFILLADLEPMRIGVDADQLSHHINSINSILRSRSASTNLAVWVQTTDAQLRLVVLREQSSCIYNIVPTLPTDSRNKFSINWIPSSRATNRNRVYLRMTIDLTDPTNIEFEQERQKTKLKVAPGSPPQLLDGNNKLFLLPSHNIDLSTMSNEWPKVTLANLPLEVSLLLIDLGAITPKPADFDAVVGNYWTKMIQIFESS